MLSPLIKWAGGKRQILPTLMMHFPKEFNNYYEPFVGAGSVFMELYNKQKLDGKTIYISDIMVPLINLYNVVSLQAEALIEELSNPKYANDREIYLGLRQRFNQIKKEEPTVELAALFVYLNKTGFNGMYRENAKGEYNIPFGKQNAPMVCNRTAISNLTNFLSLPNVTVKCGDYLETEPLVQRGDFVYMDPPYYGTFTGYNKDEFGEAEQRRLRDYFLLLTQRGVLVALSNSDCDFIRGLYQDVPGVRMIQIPVKRMINSKVEARGQTKIELLIVNYPAFV
jgi:DNA adenine methylase